MIRKTFFAGLAALLFASGANAAVIYGLVKDPSTTAGLNSSSNRSGAGTWHLYAVDTSADSGISSFDALVASTGGLVSATNRAPQTNYDQDGGGTPGPAGFTLLRQTLGNGTATVELTGAQPTPPSANSGSNVGNDYFPISGFGQNTGTFAAKYANPILGPTTGAQWGTYSDPELLGPEAVTANPSGKKWVFLGEGTYTGQLLIPTGSTTTYQDFATTFASTPPTGGTTGTFLTAGGTIPEPTTLSMFGLAMVGSMGLFRRRNG